jgi:hypothetical protein
MNRVQEPSPSSAVLRRILGAVALAIFCLLLAAPASQAQNAGGLPGFFQSLFGIFPRAAPPPSANGPLRERAHKPRRKQDFVSSTATRPVVQPTFFISVLGDSLAISTSQGLSDAFSANPEVAINDLARDVSGLARDDYYDWPKAARDLVAAKPGTDVAAKPGADVAAKPGADVAAKPGVDVAAKPGADVAAKPGADVAAKPRTDVAVVMIGINDLQPLKDGGEMLDPLTDKWRAAYGKKVDALLAPLRDAHVPVLWVGLPPMRDDRLNAEAAALNEIYRDRAAKAGATFIDIWDAFADASGQYAAFGPDVEGQNAKLRNGSGGIYFTKAGARKVAQFLEADIRRDLEKSKPQDNLTKLPPDIAKEASDINAEILRAMGDDARRAGSDIPIAKPIAGPIISLTAPPASAGGALVSPTDAAAIRISAQQAVGSPTAAPPGRADDFSWPPSK